DPDMAASDDCLAIRIAGMVEEARFVALERRVDARTGVENEQKRGMPLHRRVVVPAIRLGIADFFTDVLDDLRSLRDVGSRERPQSVNVRSTKLHPIVHRTCTTGS